MAQIDGLRRWVRRTLGFDPGPTKSPLLTAAEWQLVIAEQNRREQAETEAKTAAMRKHDEAVQALALVRQEHVEEATKAAVEHMQKLLQAGIDELKAEGRRARVEIADIRAKYQVVFERSVEHFIEHTAIARLRDKNGGREWYDVILHRLAELEKRMEVLERAGAVQLVPRVTVITPDALANVEDERKEA